MTPKEQIELERLVDTYGLSGVLGNLADLCHEKAEHVRVNWSDPRIPTGRYVDNDLAKEWDRNGRLVAKVSEKVVDL